METRPVKSSSVPPVRPYEPNAILHWFYERFFSHITIDEKWSETVRGAARRGVVVYVMRSISFLDFLCLDFLTKRFALPLVRFVNDLGLSVLEPFGKGGRRLRFRRQIPEERALSEVMLERFSALLFLRRPPKVGASARHGRELETDLIRTLVETQRKLEEPILLVPQTFVWTKLPPNKKPTLLDLFFGPSEWPGRIRVFFQFLINYRNAVLTTGDPFDLAEFIDAHQDLTDAEMADKVRYALLRRMERERGVVLGPRKKTPGRIRDELIRSPRIRRQIESQARATKKSVAKVERAARKELRRLCADPDPYTVALIHRLFSGVWNRIYDGIEIDRPGLERVREAAREGSVILLPSHKSHIDYLILSDILFTNALSFPLIAAGENLNFWPAGAILRRGGGFFIRRSFRGKKLYAALVDAYMRKLLVEGFTLEFFLEGGRSRTGKLLPPKYGLLSMVVDACLALPGRKVFFVPISIGYERIIEEGSYVDEQSGGEKQKENIGGLLKTPRVLRSRYGRLYVQFAEPLEFSTFLAEVRGDHGGNGQSAPTNAPKDEHDVGSALALRDRDDDDVVVSLPPNERRALIQRLAHRVVYRINQVTIVTPAALLATTLLAHRRRGITHDELVASSQRIASVLARLGARFGRSILDKSRRVREDTVAEGVQLFLDGKLVVRHDPPRERNEQPGDGESAIYGVPEERRIALEYYKNNILHFFVPSALISAALTASHGEPVSEATLRERVRQLSRLFKYEFMFRADATFDEIFDDALTDMLGAGELERMADRIQPAEGEGGELVPVYAEMVRTYFETYRLAIRGAATLLADGSLPRKEWIKRTLALGQRMYLAGELDLRESLSKLRLENATTALRDLGVLRTGEAGAIERGPAADDPEELAALESRLAAAV